MVGTVTEAGAAAVTDVGAETVAVAESTLAPELDDSPQVVSSAHH